MYRLISPTNIFVEQSGNFLSKVVDVKIEQGWKQVLASEFAKPYFEELTKQVKRAYQVSTVYPRGQEIFAAFDACPFHETKVVILGQDPYHGPGQAHGLSFSVREGMSLPPSLNNIFKEVAQDTGSRFPTSGELTRWARQGVLLLNASLTVEHGKANSHVALGWHGFTDAVIQKLNFEKCNLVFMLWGSFAQKKAVFIDPKKHLVLKAPHPSPLSAHRGFFGCRHFSKTNEYLTSRGILKINW